MERKPVWLILEVIYQFGESAEQILKMQTFIVKGEIFFWEM